MTREPKEPNKAAPAPLSAAQVEMLVRDDAQADAVRRQLEGWSEAQRLAGGAVSREKSQPRAASPEEARTLAAGATDTPETAETSRSGKAHPRFTPPDT